MGDSAAKSSGETRPQDKRKTSLKWWNYLRRSYESFKHLYDVTSPRHRVKQNSWDGKVEVRVVRPLVVDIHANGHTRAVTILS